MISGWIIKFKDGYVVALTEDKYTIWSKNNSKEDVLVEQHWFDLEAGCKENNIATILN